MSSVYCKALMFLRKTVNLLRCCCYISLSITMIIVFKKVYTKKIHLGIIQSRLFMVNKLPLQRIQRKNYSCKIESILSSIFVAVACSWCISSLQKHLPCVIFKARRIQVPTKKRITQLLYCRRFRLFTLNKYANKWSSCDIILM